MNILRLLALAFSPAARRDLLEVTRALDESRRPRIVGVPTVTSLVRSKHIAHGDQADAEFRELMGRMDDERRKVGI